jgi:hypothetical protein
MKPQVQKIKRYSIELVDSNPNSLFIFGDNLIKRGLGGQAIIRNCENAYGIPTKKLPTMSHNAFFSDYEYDRNVQHIKKAIDNIPNGSYDTIVFPEDGLGTGLAALPTKAPKTYAFLIDYLNVKFGNVYGS